MRAVVQRVKRAQVRVNGEVVGKISKGILALVGIGVNDGEKDVKWMADKLVNLRIFEDENSKMNLSLLDVGGEILLVSQFTLYGDCRRGRRPSFTDAADPERGRRIFEDLVQYLRQKYGNLRVETGVFRAMMEVELVNDGPVTILLDSEKKF